MEMPILEFPKYVDELCKDFEHLFAQERQMLQFKRLMSGFAIADKHTIAHMNGLFVYHTNQSNLNRFIRESKWDPKEMNRIKINLINRMEDEEGVLILDDYIIKKYGKNMYGVDYYFDHSEGKSVWGLQIADCVLSGKGIYPLLSTIYVRKDSRWAKKFKTKIEIQMEHLTQLHEMGLNFSCVVMDAWYLNKDLTVHIEKMDKDWVAECKSNRLVLSKGKWIPLSEFAKKKIDEEKFRVVEIGEDTYIMKAFTVYLKKMGKVRLLVSLNKDSNFNFYVTNRLNWNEVKIVKMYSRRWDIEVWHREGKGDYGIEECQLRSDEAISKYLSLNALAAVLLAIASMLSPLYATLINQGRTPEVKHRWILLELVSQLISSASKVKDDCMKHIAESIIYPYKSTLKNRKSGVMG